MTIDQARKMQAMARWHRRFALVVMAWLAFLAISGFFVNHSNDWALDRKPLAATLQAWVYGIDTTGPDYCSAYPETAGECGGIFAVLDLPAGKLLLGEHSLFLADLSGRLIEKLSVRQTGLDALEAGFASGADVYLRGAAMTVRTSPDLFEFHRLDGPESKALSGIAWKSRGQGTASVTWERFLLDLHAARFLGPFAKVFNDLMAALILVLAVSGIWLYRLKLKSNGY